MKRVLADEDGDADSKDKADPTTDKDAVDPNANKNDGKTAEVAKEEEAEEAIDFVQQYFLENKIAFWIAFGVFGFFLLLNICVSMSKLKSSILYIRDCGGDNEDVDQYTEIWCNDPKGYVFL